MSSEKKFNIKTFGNDVLSYRVNELQFSRGKFSTETGISKHVINHIENGQTVPNIDDAYKLANLMGKTLEDYFQYSL